MPGCSQAPQLPRRVISIGLGRDLTLLFLLPWAFLTEECSDIIQAQMSLWQLHTNSTEALKLRSWISDPHQSNRKSRSAHQRHSRAAKGRTFYTHSHMAPKQTLLVQSHLSTSVPTSAVVTATQSRAFAHAKPVLSFPGQNGKIELSTCTRKAEWEEKTRKKFHLLGEPESTFITAAHQQKHFGEKVLQSKAGISTDDTMRKNQGQEVFPQICTFIRNRDFLFVCFQDERTEKKKNHAAPPIMEYTRWQNAACLVSKDP